MQDFVFLVRVWIAHLNNKLKADVFWAALSYGWISGNEPEQRIAFINNNFRELKHFTCKRYSIF